MSSTLPLPSDPRRAILVGGAAVAAADMAMALGYWALKGVAPSRIVQGIAAGWIGRDAALAGGSATVVLGAVSHLAIATAMVACYWVASRRFAVLTARPIACGLLYGVATWAAMKFVVIPLSALEGRSSPDLVWQCCHFASHLFIVGVPSAWLARRLTQASSTR